MGPSPYMDPFQIKEEWIEDVIVNPDDGYATILEEPHDDAPGEL